MLSRRAAKKLVIYVNALEHYHHKPLFEAIVEFLYENEVAGATVTRCIAGYGKHGEFHESKLFTLSDDVPMRIEAVDDEGKIMSLLPALKHIVGEAVIALLDVDVIRSVDETEAEQTQKSGRRS